MMEILAALVGSSALAALISGFFGLYNSNKRKNTGLLDGVQCLMYDRLKYLTRNYIDKGWICPEDLEDLTRMHKVYHDGLGGNGYLDDNMTKVKALPGKPAE